MSEEEQLSPRQHGSPVGAGRHVLSSPATCPCGAHGQHVVFRFLWNHPSATLKTASTDLKMSYNAVRLAKSRFLRRPMIHRYCPECFRPSLFTVACENCGYEIGRPNIQEVDFESQSPVHSVQPLNGLGTQPDYENLHLQYGGRNIAHLVERPKDHLQEKCKSLLWEELKGLMLPDGVVEQATALLVKEIAEFRSRYPSLINSKKVARQLVQNVISTLKLRYPRLRRVSVSETQAKENPKQEED